MALGGFTLADRLGAKAHPCKVAGCTRTWIELPGKALGLGRAKGAATADAGGDPGAGMCDPCRAKRATLVDKERRCDTPGCQGRWTWSVKAQLEAFATNRQPPRGLCASCDARLASFEEKEVACGIPGCGRKALLTKRAQLLAENAAQAEAQAKEAEAAQAGAAAPADAPSGAEAEATDGAQPTGQAADGDQTTALAAEATDSSQATDGTEAADGIQAADSSQTHDGATQEANGAGTIAQGTDAEASPLAQGHGRGQGRGAEGGAPRGAPRANGNGKHAKGHGPKGDKDRPKPGKVTFKGPFCAPCADVAKRLQDRPVACGINGCKRKWIWKADDQIQAFAAGKPNEPPRRMCDECRASFGKLTDREVRCRTSGCKKTWTWSRFDQLDACVANKPAPKAPSRMCDSCYGLFSTLKDIERPCRKGGCKRTWTDKRGAQLARAVRGKTGDPYPQYCSEHQKELGELEDREIGCKTEGCPGTWTWSREQQLAAGVRPEPRPEDRNEARGQGKSLPPEAQTANDGAVGDPATASEGVTPDASRVDNAAPMAAAGSDGEEAQSGGQAAQPGSETAQPGGQAAQPGSEAAQQGRDQQSRGQQGRDRGPRRDKRDRRRRRHVQPPERLCGACGEFLKDRKTLEIPCNQCGTAIYWPPESQLQTHLGNWAAPTLCGACKRDATEKAREAAREALRAHGGDGGGQEPGVPAPGADGQEPEAPSATADAPVSEAPPVAEG